jgi:hypothetical protein
MCHSRSDGERQPCLADASRSRHRQERHILTADKFDDSRDITFPPNEWGA